MADVNVLGRCLSSRPTMLGDGEDQLMGDLVETEAEDRVGSKRHLCELQELCQEA